MQTRVNMFKILVFSLFITLIITVNISPQNYGNWTSVSPMNLDRKDLASVVLPNGNVLVTGGQSFSANEITNTAEIYNYKTDTWDYVASMNVQRAIHRMVLLDNNRVLVIGGYKLRTCEIYFINDNIWQMTDSLKVKRDYGWTASSLNNGEVLVAGGFVISNDLKNIYSLNNVEIYDPSLNKWRETDSLKIDRAFQTATLLNNGKLLISGGETDEGIELKESEIFDPTLEKWTVVDSLNTARYRHSEILLSNGNVLISGGLNFTYPTAPWLKSCEVYNPTTNNWEVVTSMNYTRVAHSSIILNNGYILFTGGESGNEKWELYDPILYKNIYSDNFPVVQSSQRIEKLQNGSVISMGGITWRDSSLPVLSSTAMCEIYFTVTGITVKLQNSSNMFELFQNYPNPFNPETTISFQLSTLSFVTLKVFEVLGKEVATLVNEEKPTGKYVVKFNAGKLASGIYIYQLKTNGKIISKKMILMK